MGVYWKLNFGTLPPPTGLKEDVTIPSKIIFDTYIISFREFDDDDSGEAHFDDSFFYSIPKSCFKHFTFQVIFNPLYISHIQFHRHCIHFCTIMFGDYPRMKTKTNCLTLSALTALILGCGIFQNANAVHFSEIILYMKNHIYLEISVVTTTCRYVSTVIVSPLLNSLTDELMTVLHYALLTIVRKDFSFLFPQETGVEIKVDSARESKWKGEEPH